MKATIYISGVIGEETTLLDVIRQYKSFSDVTELEAVIHSEGGSVQEGEAIYNYLKGLNIPITTTTDKAYSIAAKIFAAGNVRNVEDFEKAIMIHFAWADVQGKAEKLEMVAGQLRELEDDFASFYSEFLAIDSDAIRTLLDNETFISGKEAVELGFATNLKQSVKAVALYNYKSNNEKMTEKKKETLGKKLLDAMAAFISGEDSVEINAALILQDSTGTEIVFTEIEETAMPKVGDIATIGGEPVPDGSYVMPSMEDQTFVFVGGKLTEIMPKEEEMAQEEQEQPTAEQVEAKLQDLLNEAMIEVKAEIAAEYEAKIEAKDAEIVALKAKIGSKEIVTEEQNNDEGEGKKAAYQVNALMQRKKTNK